MARNILVEVLGPVRVRGLAEPFRRAASRELVVFLAFHRGGVRQAECAQALWPDRPIAASTIHSTSSDARRALGRAHLPCRGTVLELASSVSTDADRFALMAARGDPDSLLEAMHMIRGAPFSELRQVDWAVFDGTQARLEMLVVDTALRCADQLVGLGRAPEAEWVVRRALSANPFDERLYRALLKATHAHGDRVRLRATMAQLVRLATAGDPSRTVGPSRYRPSELETFHPETAAVYRELLTGTPATGAPPTRQ